MQKIPFFELDVRPPLKVAPAGAKVLPHFDGHARGRHERRRHRGIRRRGDRHAGDRRRAISAALRRLEE